MDHPSTASVIVALAKLLTAYAPALTLILKARLPRK